MSKNKASRVSLLYLLGTLAVVVGFCFPITKGVLQGIANVFGKTINGFNYINFDKFDMTSLGALLIFVGAACGLAVAVLTLSKIKVPAANFLMFIMLIASIAGGVILFFIAKDGVFTHLFGGKNVIKHFFQIAYVGFYMIFGGWLAALIGITTKI